MKRRDIYWVAAYGLLAAATVLLCVTGGFAWFNAMYPYLAGFIQFSVYATGGRAALGADAGGTLADQPGHMVQKCKLGSRRPFCYPAFSVFSQGTQQAMAAGLLPGYGNALALAFFTSCTNNLFFAPIHSADAGVWKLWRDPLSGGRHITPRQAVDSVDWGELVDFTLFKTIPLFWIPINTVGFLLPQEYRIVFAAVLSLVFGILMTILKLRERKNQSRKESLV